MSVRYRKFAVYALVLMTVPFVPRKTDTGEKPQTPVVRTTRVHSGVVEATIRLAGTVSTVDAVTLRAPRMPGRRGEGGGNFSLTLHELAKPGSKVSKGEMVADFDRQYMLVRLDDQKASVLQEEANIRRLRAELKRKLSAHELQIHVAKGQLDKAALDLKTVPVRSAIQAEILRLRHEEALANYQQLIKERPLFEASERAALRMSELNLTDDQMELRRAEANLDRMKITAPIKGIVIPQPVRRGTDLAEVAAGDELRSGQPFVSLVDTSGLIVDAVANQIDADLLRIGQRARVMFDALPGIVIPAHIVAVGTSASGSRRPDHVRQIPVRLRLESTHPDIFPNTTASADIVVASEDATAVVSRQAVFESSDGVPRAFVQNGAEWEARDLVLGLANHIEVAVLDGLRDGEVAAAENITAK
jgi:multidrug efflux pump subunit AcrA (membrane-fusion protein)